MGSKRVYLYTRIAGRELEFYAPVYTTKFALSFVFIYTPTRIPIVCYVCLAVMTYRRSFNIALVLELVVL